MLSRLKDVDEECWKRGASVGLPLEGGALAWAVAGCGRTLLVVPSMLECRRIELDVELLKTGNSHFVLEEPPLESESLCSEEVFLGRGSVLHRWQNSDGLLLATPGALLTPFRYGEDGMELEVGKKVGRDALARWLAENGYHRTELVWKSGDFAVRGGIIDFYDPSSDGPLRVEFFDEDIDSLRMFQPRTQRSYEPLRKFLIKSAIHADEGGDSPFRGIPFRALLVMPRQLERRFQTYRDLWNQMVAENQHIDENAFESFQLNCLGSRLLRLLSPGERPLACSLALEPVPPFKASLRDARAYVQSMEQAGFTVHLTSRTFSNAEALGQKLQLVRGVSLSGGFVDNSEKQIWISDAELFGTFDSTSIGLDSGMPADLQESLSPGQWVVHEDYGVCKLLTTSMEEFDGHQFETLVLEFADAEKLIIPFSELYRLSPWSGDGDPVPDRLGSKHWKKNWQQAEQQIEQEAQELLNLYAERELAKGRVFQHDGELSNQFKDTFPFVETRDQLRAIDDIRRDMESPWPMDRLIVGDVGYGKTEVVLRGAVKAVESGAQVALAAPTTVLAQQHFRTCQARIGSLPIRVELLSRMVSPAHQKMILKDIADGKVDIVIGTHRIFQGDIVFKDLGLLIIDEEQRFGVKHKEALRMANPGLDVISLSATPIPRTLSLALRGVRDISVIATPPKSRGEIFTITARRDDQLIHNAIAREIARGGQIYFLHNRVEDILNVALKLRSEFPEIRIDIAHGQMKERELAETMTNFYEGKIQILVCTTIVESGLDVPRANTLIVDDVRRLGLAQMHQIRGRIGRRSENAYALFLYPEEEDLPGATRERLEALGAVSSQNSGYRLAQRDLEIRGAGDILGRNQHGFREKIGYNLYFRKLRERVDVLRGKETKEVLLDLQVFLTIPVSYLPQVDLRIGLYRRLAQALTPDEYRLLAEEIRDRYGPLPGELQGLLDLALIRGEGVKNGFVQVTVRDQFISVRGVISPGLLPPPLWRHGGTSIVGPGGIRGIAELAKRMLNSGRKLPMAKELDENG